MAGHIEDALLFSLAQKGDRYVFGAEVKAPYDSDKWDCSELVEAACAKAGITPTVPDGAYFQWKHSKDAGLLIPVAQGIKTRGALLFVGDGTGFGRDAITHVAWSLGDGTTIEARGTKWGVGCWPAAGRFDFAALIPGADYTPRKPVPSAPAGPPLDQDVNLNRRGLVDLAYWSVLGRAPENDDAANLWVLYLAQNGLPATVKAIAATREATTPHA